MSDASKKPTQLRSSRIGQECPTPSAHHERSGWKDRSGFAVTLTTSVVGPLNTAAIVGDLAICARPLLDADKKLTVIVVDHGAALETDLGQQGEPDVPAEEPEIMAIVIGPYGVSTLTQQIGEVSDTGCVAGIGIVGPFQVA